MKPDEIVKLTKFLRGKFAVADLTVRKRPQKDDSAEVYIGEEFVGVIFRDDEDGEVHQSEAVEEKISLSERFGLWLSFHQFNQARYLDIVVHWLKQLGVADPASPEARHAALQWALLHGSRSGRSAQQFARDWAGRQALSQVSR